MNTPTRIAEPLFFKPHFEERVWGGNHLGQLYAKDLPPGKVIGESWEVSDRPEAQSVVVGGAFEGWPLAQFMERLPAALLGPALAARHLDRFPLLAKYIDAGQDLSVQVHPDDAGCRRLGIPDRGKAECWVILHAAPGSRINRGLKPGVTRTLLEQALNHGHMRDVLHFFQPQPGDVVAIPPGTVHAIGAGIVLAEIQQNSDVTFRVYDYNRAGLNGERRELHLEESLETISLSGPPVGFFNGDMAQDTLAQAALTGHSGVTTSTLLTGRYFDLGRTVLAPGTTLTPPQRRAVPAILMCVRGQGALNGRALAAGQTALLPADLPAVTFSVPASASEPLVLLESSPTAEA